MKYFESYLERSLYIVLLLVFLVISGVIFLQYQSNRHLSEEVASLTSQLATNTSVADSIKTNTTQAKAEIDDLKNHIDCIVALFATPNRTDFYISDIQNCNISSVSSSGGATSSPKVP